MGQNVVGSTKTELTVAMRTGTCFPVPAIVFAALVNILPKAFFVTTKDRAFLALSSMASSVTCWLSLNYASAGGTLLGYRGRHSTSALAVTIGRAESVFGNPRCKVLNILGKIWSASIMGGHQKLTFLLSSQGHSRGVAWHFVFVDYTSSIA